MMIKCPVCGAHVPPEVAVEVMLDDEIEHYCSLRCVETAEAQGRATPLAERPALPDLPKRILVAVDGSGPSVRAAELAASLARACGGSVALLHVIDPLALRWLPIETAIAGGVARAAGSIDVEQQMRSEAEAQLERCQRVCEAAGVPVAWRVEVDAPVRAIANAAEDADLVVMGSRGLGALSGAALGSLSHRVLGQTRKPILVVH